VETLEGSAGKNLSRDELGSKFQIKFQIPIRIPDAELHCKTKSQRSKFETEIRWFDPARAPVSVWLKGMAQPGTDFRTDYLACANNMNTRGPRSVMS
jgi:hypothetical protein